MGCVNGGVRLSYEWAVEAILDMLGGATKLGMIFCSDAGEYPDDGSCDETLNEDGDGGALGNASNITVPVNSWNET